MTIRRCGTLLLSLLVATVSISCGRSTSSTRAVGTTSAPVSSAPVVPSTSTPWTPTPDDASSAPSGVATPFGQDLPAGDVPPTSLVPDGTDPAGSWFAQTTTGDAIVVAWQARSADPFRTDRGVVVWRHTGEPALWRPVFAATYPASRHPVLGITSTISEMTGDGSQDALVFAETGGTGACGTYLVIDVSTGTQAFRRSVCDTTIEPSGAPPGLVLTEAVYAHGDPHCCPSSTRTTVLRRDADGTWRTISMTTTPT